MKINKPFCAIATAALVFSCSVAAYAQQENTTSTEVKVEPTPQPSPDVTPESKHEQVAAPAPQVTITDIKIGNGAEAVDGQKIAVHYTGWLFDPKAGNHHGKKFDSSYDRGMPITIRLGEHRVIQGWEQGLLGMKVGGKRTLIIPSELAYGTRGASGLIPPNATLVFDVNFVAVFP